MNTKRNKERRKNNLLKGFVPSFKLNSMAEITFPLMSVFFLKNKGLDALSEISTMVENSFTRLR